MDHGFSASRLTGKRAVVTAAAQGIGRAIAERLAAEGAQVLALDLNGDKLRELDGSITTSVLDATDPDAVASMLADYRCDILAHCVGWVHSGNLAGTSYADWQRSFRINTDSAYLMVSALLPGMLRRGTGSVIVIASAASSVGGFPNRVAYGASKAALIGMTKALAADHVRDGVRFNAICPGTVQSPSLEERINANADPDAARAAFIARQPMGRLGQPEEIAALAAYLAADESAFMTGSVLVLDGGATELGDQNEIPPLRPTRLGAPGRPCPDGTSMTFRALCRTSARRRSLACTASPCPTSCGSPGAAGVRIGPASGSRASSSASGSTIRTMRQKRMPRCPRSRSSS